VSERRWNPISGEWVITATHRQNRVHLPPKEYCPLCPTKPGASPTEVPRPDYEFAVFLNKSPSMRTPPLVPAVQPEGLFDVTTSDGVCEVILYTPRHNGTLTDASVDEIERLIYVWTDRFQEIGSLEHIKYVYIFENKGEVIGVTLNHPHGQIYAFPYVPPIPQRELANAKKHYDKTGRCLFCDVMQQEIDDGRRIVVKNDCFLAVVPFYARWSYEVHITSLRHASSMLEFDPATRRSLAEILKTVMLKLDNLWGISMPYMMLMHQAPTDGGEYPHYHYHIEFYTPLRTKEKLKYLAGCESGAGTFITETRPEESAEQLRRAEPPT
jgi:UDPglucose--hexose-1-phosphate uridylyltransferase